ncbi:hypothetical protein SASPL_128329 [Salvia splendens]|uniref:Uncharacterized protein n=1 Tax=Salvia splendens TaxID=180675 RepID=A0A8X8XB34_SALSN|nr:hypothetical protein SASPL_128329 [Salvia splendens]
MRTNTTVENRRKTKKSTPFPSTRRARPDSLNRRSSSPPSAAAIVDVDLFVREFESPESSNPRSFPHSVKCFFVPDVLGGKSTLENCQVLQATVNRSKGNRTEISKSELIRKSAYCRVSDRDMDFLELSSYGNVRRGQDSGGCKIQYFDLGSGGDLILHEANDPKRKEELELPLILSAELKTGSAILLFPT